MKSFNQFNTFSEQRKYPDGTKIPDKLPPAYSLAKGKNNCANCGAYVPATKYCKVWDAKVRPQWWCKKWIPLEKKA